MAYQFAEIIYLRNYKRPFFVFHKLFTKTLSDSDRGIIQENFPFYNKLKPKYKRYFEDRILEFIKTYKFEGRGVVVTSEMKILVAASYVKLTFGFRDYLSKTFNTILFYPEAYYSLQHNQYHKGEFNPKMKIVVFSWKDFKQGIAIANDNLNLGLHEFTHVTHIEAHQSNNHKSILFRENLQNLFYQLSKSETKQKLIESGFLRDYAYENKFEFVAVLLEHFFESPEQLKSQFPEIYLKVKEMINFNENRFTL